MHLIPLNCALNICEDSKLYVCLPTIYKKENETKQDAFKSVLLQKFNLGQKPFLLSLSGASKQDLNKLFPSYVRVFERQISSMYTDTSCTHNGRM